MSRLKRDAKLKSLSLAAGLVASCCLAVSLQGHDVTTCQSPDRKFRSALRLRGQAALQRRGGDCRS